ncbi:MAG: amidohydrolase family protein [Thermodesulfovibrionales bacterium]|nr:amidohydrolase family protein [Thermodesulfovibrionales bacterium]
MKPPEVIDVHTHGAGLLDTRAGSARDIQDMAGLYGQAGVTAILPTIYPGEIDQMHRDMAAVMEAMEEQGPYEDNEDRQEGVARILGVHLEGPFLNPERSGALDAASFLAPTSDNLSEVTGGFKEIIKVMTVAPELDGALGVIEQCADMGIRVSMGHSDATYAEAAEGKRAGATCVTHLFNAMRPFHHREPGLAGFGLFDPDVYVEIIPDGVHVVPEVVEMVFKLKPLERILLVSDSVKGPMYRDGVLQGSKIMLSRAAHALGRSSIEPAAIQRALSDNPKKYLGLT